MLKDTFCSSPWFHIRMTYSGELEECRWMHRSLRSVGNKTKPNFDNVSLMEFYNSSEMKSLRQDLLNGNKPKICESCYYQDEFDLPSGRTKQLLKSGVSVDNFPLTMRSSPHFDNFLYSHQTHGQANYHPVDLQIDLGNLCNSACIMCNPRASTRLQQDYKKLTVLNSNLFDKPIEFKPWSRNPELVKKFINELCSIPNIKYIHFLGGETLYDSTFFEICEALIDAGLAKNIIVGSTTNGTIYNNRVERLIKEFKEFHLGISIESVTTLNDYVRYPAKIDEILSNIDKFLALRNNSHLYASLRITPNIFTISELDKLYEYMIKNHIIAEACDILHEPECLKIELIPDEIRNDIISKLSNLIVKYNLNKNTQLNIRRNDLIPTVIANSIIDYTNFIKNYTIPDNAEELRYKLVDFLHAFEALRKNSILDYAPQYEKFLRSYGY
jgi:sulfatase maturation enzyme AslB (radical SAM superfamily)